MIVFDKAHRWPRLVNSSLVSKLFQKPAHGIWPALFSPTLVQSTCARIVGLIFAPSYSQAVLTVTRLTEFAHRTRFCDNWMSDCGPPENNRKTIVGYLAIHNKYLILFRDQNEWIWTIYYSLGGYKVSMYFLVIMISSTERDYF